MIEITVTSWQMAPGPYDQATVARIMNRFRGDGVCYELANKLLVYANTPTAMNVLVATGGCQIQGYGMFSDAITTLTIAAASGTLNRIDRIVARLTPTSSPGNIALAVLTGTAASSPVAPALTQTDGGVWEIELAQVSIAANTTSITTAMITAAASQPLCAWAMPWLAGITLSQARALTLPGSLTLPTAQIHGVADPSDAQDADTKAARNAAISAAISTINPSGRLLNTTMLTTAGSGTFTTTAATHWIRVTIWGGGGGGGSGSQYYSGGGAASSGLSIWIKIAVSPSTGYAYVVGAAGAIHTAGSPSKITINGVTYTSSFGNPGSDASESTNVTPVAAGTVPTSGDIRIAGNSSSGTIAGRATGAGGAGGAGGGSPFQSGNAGSPGAIIIEEFS